MRNINRPSLTKKQFNQLCNLIPEIRESPNIDFYQKVCQNYKKLPKRSVRKFRLNSVMPHPFMHHQTNIKKIMQELLQSSYQSSKKNYKNDNNNKNKNDNNKNTSNIQKSK